MQQSEYLKELFQAYQNEGLLSLEAFPEDIKSLSDAYSFQEAFTELKEKAGEELAGYKIMRHDDENLYGAITKERLVNSLELSKSNHPKVELELVFLAKSDLSVDDSDKELIEKLQVTAGLEIPDSRYQEWDSIELNNCQILADGATNGWQVNSDDAIEAADVNLTDIKGQLTRNNEEFASGSKNNAFEGLKWLIKSLAERNQKIKAGQFITSGTLFPPQDLLTGSYIGQLDGIAQVELLVK